LGRRPNSVESSSPRVDGGLHGVDDPSDFVFVGAASDGMVAQTPLGRLGQPEDIARAVVFLASDDASWITGQVLQSSGGLML